MMSRRRWFRLEINYIAIIEILVDGTAEGKFTVTALLPVPIRRSHNNMNLFYFILYVYKILNNL